MKTNRLIIWLTCYMVFFLTGCATYYYRVTEPISRKEYYTTYVDFAWDGSIIFEDDRTGSQVILESSELVEISSDEFRISTRK